MRDEPLRGIRACVFDAYGTLFDYASAATRCQDVLGDKTELLNLRWREKQLQYTWLRSLQDRYADFWEITGDALDFTMETLGLEDPALRERLMNLYLKLLAFSDAKETLADLKSRGMRTAILSNGSAAMLRTAVESAKIGHLLDLVLSVDEVGVYKPHPRVYGLAVDRLGVPASAIAFSSSNAWDAYGASSFGMRVIWCNRYQQRPEHLPGRPDHIVSSLSEIVPLVQP
jgi:2-haloacid dehalogenase